jgi:hypothetical protein
MKNSLKNLTEVLSEKGEILTSTQTTAVKGGCGCDLRKPPIK